MLKTRVNHQIKAAEIRLINEEGQQIGILKLSDALRMAEEYGLDLVEVSPNAMPPVVKLIDFSKFKYQQKKTESLQKKNARKTEVKTIWLTARISEHDMQIKAGKASEFLEAGDLVRVELRMKGREQAYGDLARRQLESFLKLISQAHRVEIPIKRMGPTWSVTVAPSK